MTTNILEDCIIALNGRFPGATQDDIKEMIKENGAKFTTKVNEKTTHLITASPASTQAKQAVKYPEISIVRLKWLIDSTKNGSKADETAYAVDVQVSEPQARPAKRAVEDEDGDDGHTDKRLRSEEIDEEVDKKLKDAFDNLEQDGPLQSISDTQVARSNTLRVPKDPECRNLNNAKVYVGKDRVIHDVTLNQTNAEGNHNKFFKIQVLVNKSIIGTEYYTWTRWGRIGDIGTGTLHGDGLRKSAVEVFLKKFKDKTGYNWTERSSALTEPKKNKYSYLPVSYESDSDKGEGEADQHKTPSVLHRSVRELMELIFNKDMFQSTMSRMNYDSGKLPLGCISAQIISKGYSVLRELSELLQNPELAESKYDQKYSVAVTDLSNKYLTMIPHVCARTAVPIIDDVAKLKVEVELLDSLREMRIAEKIMKKQKETDAKHPSDSQFEGLDLVEMTPLEIESEEYTHLADYLYGSQGKTHILSFRLLEVFRIERKGERQRFESKHGTEPQDRRLLWHGSRCANFAGILSEGLRIAPPEAPKTGSMFDKGIYLADVSSKSARYCLHEASGDVGLLLLCEAELGGQMLELKMADYSAAAKAQEGGHITTWGVGQTYHAEWQDAGCINENLAGVKFPNIFLPPVEDKESGSQLLYNEYVCYSPDQVRLRYLFKVKMEEEDWSD